MCVCACVCRRERSDGFRREGKFKQSRAADRLCQVSCFYSLASVNAMASTPFCLDKQTLRDFSSLCPCFLSSSECAGSRRHGAHPSLSTPSRGLFCLSSKQLMCSRGKSPARWQLLVDLLTCAGSSTASACRNPAPSSPWTSSFSPQTIGAPSFPSSIVLTIFLKRFIISVFICMCVCVHVCSICVHVQVCACRTEDSIRCPGTGIASHCKLPDTGAGN